MVSGCPITIMRPNHDFCCMSCDCTDPIRRTDTSVIKFLLANFGQVRISPHASWTFHRIFFQLRGLSHKQLPQTTPSSYSNGMVDKRKIDPTTKLTKSDPEPWFPINLILSHPCREKTMILMRSYDMCTFALGVKVLLCDCCFVVSRCAAAPIMTSTMIMTSPPDFILMTWHDVAWCGKTKLENSV